MRACLLPSLLVPALLAAQAPAPAKARLEPLNFLLGTWVGEGGGAPGQASGGTTFEAQLGGQVLVRRNVAEYPAAQGRPAFRYEDLMTVYPDPTGSGVLADYFDSEGHVIRYTVTVSADGASAVFLAPPAAAPGFRLTYRKAEGGRLHLEFEIAPPGGGFKPYLRAELKRVK